MNILILTGRFGMGHCSAAEALKQQILLKAPDVKIDIVDIVDYMLPNFSDIIYGGFNFLVSKCSGVYNLLNEASAKYSRAPLKRTFVNKVDILINRYQPNLILSTLPISSQYISAYKGAKNCNIPLHTYITDITAHEEWIAKNTDMYFVGSKSTKNALISKGIEAKKIVVSGIPVKPAFKYSNINTREKKSKEILIMGGGLGLIPSSDTILKALTKNQALNITIITGKNKKLFDKITEEFPEINVIGYTNKVSEYMKKADLVITKSGGITTFEAINSDTPLYIITPFLSQEVGNANYIENLNIGRVVWSKKANISDEIIELIENDDLLKQMKANMKKTRKQWDRRYPLAFYSNREKSLCLLNC